MLVEDQRQQQFMYRFLMEASVNPRQVSFEVSPAGHGSAEQWVRENFAREVGKCRARNARATTGMFVVLDADNESVERRLEVLDNALICAGTKPIFVEQDPIARLIPKRNIETWILFLSAYPANHHLNEQQDYKHTKNTEDWSDLIPKASETFYALTRRVPALQGDLLDSIRRGIKEASRALRTKP